MGQSFSTYVAELHRAGLAQLRDGRVGGLGLNEELAQGHLLAAEHGTHVDLSAFTSRHWTTNQNTHNKTIRYMALQNHTARIFSVVT